MHQLKKTLFVVACIALLLGLGLLVAACGQSGTSGGSNTPKQAVQSMLDALKKGDWSASYNQLSSADKKQITLKQWTDAYSKQGTPPKDLTWTIGSEKITGNDAVVTVKMSQGGQSQSVPFACVKDGNTWKVSASKSSSLNQQ